jgi:hypothetical protein
MSAPTWRRAAGAIQGAGWGLLGIEDNRSLAPALAVTLVVAAAFSTFWSYAGVWAVRSLGATPVQIGVMYGAAGRVR